MRRWNGWGDASRHVPLPGAAAAVLEQLVGKPQAPQDCTLESVVAQVPESRLPAHQLISADPLERVRHARGQSFPDLIALRSGRIDAFPDGVAYPQDRSEVRSLIDYARSNGVKLIPYGGGTSVVGHINPEAGATPILTVDLSRLQRLYDLVPEDRLATFGAGVLGPDLEAQLRAHGYTLGHFPQSFELSTLGGWIAARSSGQQSLGYGRIEHLFAGGHVETPNGPFDLPVFPASAAGPDLREVVLGSEGRLGIITEATMRISPLPEREDFHAIMFANWERARSAVQSIVQTKVALSMLRLSTATETMTNLALAGHQRLIKLLERGLQWRQIGEGKCMLIVGLSGSAAAVALGRRNVLSLARAQGGIHLGRWMGQQWRKGRFRAPYLRNMLWERGWAVDTLETATTWGNVDRLLQAVETALRTTLADQGEKVHVFTHLSHIYAQGSSIYTTYVFRLADDPDATYERWQRLKHAASSAIVAHGGTISHQHGVGSDHKAYLPAEKGQLGMAALRQVFASFDPDELCNPGKLV